MAVAAMRCHLAVACVIAAALLLRGCASDRPPPTHADAARQDAQRSAPTPSSDAAATSLRLLSEELNSAHLAARRVQTMPAVGDALARREILLHVAMYRAAFQTRISRLERFVLEPVIERDPPDIGIDPEEFRLRILGALDDLGHPGAWITETWRSGGIDYFPGGSHRATRLRITILERRDEQGIVIGEISDWTADLGASRQKVTCTWDGLTWSLERDPVRVTW